MRGGMCGMGGGGPLGVAKARKLEGWEGCGNGKLDGGGGGA